MRRTLINHRHVLIIYSVGVIHCNEWYNKDVMSAGGAVLQGGARVRERAVHAADDPVHRRRRVRARARAV